MDNRQFCKEGYGGAVVVQRRFTQLDQGLGSISGEGGSWGEGKSSPQ